MYKSQEARDAQAQGGSERYCAFLDKQAAKVGRPTGCAWPKRSGRR